MEIKQVFIKSDNKFYNIRGHTDKLIIRLLVTCVQYNYRLQGVGYKTLFNCVQYYYKRKIRNVGFLFC